MFLHQPMSSSPFYKSNQSLIMTLCPTTLFSHNYSYSITYHILLLKHELLFLCSIVLSSVVQCSAVSSSVVQNYSQGLHSSQRGWNEEKVGSGQRKQQSWRGNQEILLILLFHSSSSTQTCSQYFRLDVSLLSFFPQLHPSRHLTTFFPFLCSLIFWLSLHQQMACKSLHSFHYRLYR